MIMTAKLQRPVSSLSAPEEASADRGIDTNHFFNMLRVYDAVVGCCVEFVPGQFSLLDDHGSGSQSVRD